jgi:hypothetical protein
MVVNALPAIRMLAGREPYLTIMDLLTALHVIHLLHLRITFQVNVLHVTIPVDGLGLTLIMMVLQIACPVIQVIAHLITIHINVQHAIEIPVGLIQSSIIVD